MLIYTTFDPTKKKAFVRSINYTCQGNGTERSKTCMAENTISDLRCFFIKCEHCGEQPAFVYVHRLKLVKNKRWPCYYEKDYGSPVTKKIVSKTTKRDSIKGFYCSKCMSYHSINETIRFKDLKTNKVNVEQYLGTWVYLDHNDKGEELLSVHRIKMYGFYNNGFVTSRSKDTVTFNLDTGYTYIMRGKSIDKIIYNKKVMMINATYNECEDFYFDGVDELVYSILYRAKCKRQAYHIDGYPKRCIPENISLFRLSALNRMPNATYEMYSKFCFSYSSIDRRYSKAARSFKPTDAINPKKLLKAYNLPIGTVFQNHVKTYGIDNLAFLSKFTSNQGELLNLSAKLDKIGKVDCYRVIASSFLKDCDKYHKGNGLRFLKQSLIRNNAFYNFRDTCMMYEDLKKYGEHDLSLYWRLDDVRVIHDSIMADHTTIQHLLAYKNMDINKPFELSTKESDLNDSLENFDFIVANNAKELIECGSIMHICVGSYAERMDKEQTLIVFIKSNDHFCGCIEVQKQGGKFCTLAQAKNYYNKPLDLALQKLVIDWAIAHKLDTSIEFVHDLRGYFAQVRLSENFDDLKPQLMFIPQMQIAEQHEYDDLPF